MKPLTDTRAICGRKLPVPARRWSPAMIRAITKTASTTAASRQAVSRRLERRRSGHGSRRRLFLGLRRILGLGGLALRLALALRLLGGLVVVLFLRLAQGGT